MNNQNIPNAGQKTVQAHMKIQSFVSSANPTSKDIEKYDTEVNAFLSTIDNQKRFLNGRNSYSIGDKVYTVVWFLERIADKPVTTPFGAKNEKPNDTPDTNSAEEAKA